MKVLSFGEILWDIIGEKSHIGGAPFNFASHLGRLGAKSYLISSIGNDQLGADAMLHIKENNISLSFLNKSSSPTGEVQVKLRNGIPQYDIIQDRAWDHITINHSQSLELQREPWDLLYFGSLAQRSSTNRATLKKVLPTGSFREVFFDANLRAPFYNSESLIFGLEHCTTLKINEEELPILGREIFGKELSLKDFFHSAMDKEFPLKRVLLTKGPQGIQTMDNNGSKDFPIQEKVEAIDTVGAGDSFSGAFSFAFFHTEDLEKSVQFGMSVADHVVSNHGALPEYSDDILKEAKRIAMGKFRG